MKYLKIMCIVIIPIVLLSCSGTYISYTWKSPVGYSASAKDKILVLAMAPDTSKAMRWALETEMVKALALQGYEAVSAYEQFGAKTFEGMNEQQVMNSLKDKTIKAAMTIALLDKEKEQHYSPGLIDYSAGLVSNAFLSKINYNYSKVYAPGYYTNSTNYFVDGNLYDVGEDRLIFSVQTKTLDPGSLIHLAKEYSKVIVKDLIDKKVISHHIG